MYSNGKKERGIHFEDFKDEEEEEEEKSNYLGSSVLKGLVGSNLNLYRVSHLLHVLQYVLILKSILI